jgi:hypothetical protein
LRPLRAAISAPFGLCKKRLFWYSFRVIRIGKKSRSFKEAEEWTNKQYREMTPDERIAASRILQRKVYGPNPPDVRECHKRAK